MSKLWRSMSNCPSLDNICLNVATGGVRALKAVYRNDCKAAQAHRYDTISEVYASSLYRNLTAAGYNFINCLQLWHIKESTPTGGIPSPSPSPLADATDTSPSPSALPCRARCGNLYYLDGEPPAALPCTPPNGTAGNFLALPVCTPYPSVLSNDVAIAASFGALSAAVAGLTGVTSVVSATSTALAGSAAPLVGASSGAMMLVSQLQFVSLSAQASNLPVYSKFASSLQWTNLQLGLPSALKATLGVAATRRRLSSAPPPPLDGTDAWLAQMGTTSTELFVGNMLWVTVTLLAICVVHFILLRVALVKCIRHKHRAYEKSTPKIKQNLGTGRVTGANLRRRDFHLHKSQFELPSSLYLSKILLIYWIVVMPGIAQSSCIAIAKDASLGIRIAAVFVLSCVVIAPDTTVSASNEAGGLGYRPRHLQNW